LLTREEREQLDLLLKPPTLPHNFTYRAYQTGLRDAITSGTKRAYVVWHRRAGKDKACFQLMLEQAWLDRVGTYYYIFPTANQGRKALWQNIDNDGKRIFDHIPPALLAKKPNSVEMTIELINGSIVQVVGAKDVDRLVGTNPVGIVFSEWPLHPGRNWDLLRPILRLNGGWCIFNGTPRGHNHAHTMWERVSKLGGWYTRLLTWRDTGLLTEADIDEERAEGMPDNLIRQEYECDWHAESEGSWLGEQLRLLREDGGIGRYPHDPTQPVHTFWESWPARRHGDLVRPGREAWPASRYRPLVQGRDHAA
jgi:phage terminase large subunit